MMMDRHGTPLNGMAMESDTSARMNAPRPCFEATTGVERRRRWSWDQKRAIVEESLSPHASAAGIARRHWIGTGQLYTWRRQLLKRQLAETPRFTWIEVAVEPPRLTGPITNPVAGTAGTTEITLADGTSVWVIADVDESALRRVLGLLRGRSGRKADRASREVSLGGDKRSARSHRRQMCAFGWQADGLTCERAWMDRRCWRNRY
jgi:transposase